MADPSLLSDTEKIQLLKQVKTIAVVGLSPKDNRPSYRVAKAMQQFSYKIVPVRPAVKTILGETAYASILDIPFDVDLVNVFRASEHVPLIVQQCIERGIRAIWLQEGVQHDQAAQIAKDAGITMVMNVCMYKEFMRLNLDPQTID